MSNDTIDSKLSTTEVAFEPSMIRSVSPRISLLIFHSEKTELRTLSEGQRLVIGRDSTADIAVVDERLSRRHAFFQVVSGEVWIEDLDSTNGTKLDGQPVTRERLLAGSEVKMGSVRASIHVQAPAPGRPVENHEGFQHAVAREAIRARFFARSFALLTVKGGKEEGADAWRSLRGTLRPVDQLAPYSADIAEILLAEATLDEARAFAEHIVAEVPVRRCGIALYPATRSTELIRQSLAALRQTSGSEKVRSIAPRDPTKPAMAKIVEGGPIVASPLMRELYEMVARLANSAIPVLLLGETGSGKEVLARALHDKGLRADKPMASINCAAIPATLMESVLFGHTKGAFTGAVSDSPGLFEEAHGGSVFLDEIGELSASAQAALLRVLETRCVRRVGSSREVEVDVRVVTATHRDLEAMCASGEFRQDLLYRINTMVLQIPPLRERPEEIAPLCELFLARANETNNSSIGGIAREAMQALHRHAWPGNVRELRNVIDRAVVIARGEQIVEADLPDGLREGTSFTAPPSVGTSSSTPAPQVEPMGVVEALRAAMAAERGLKDFKSCMERVEVEILLDALRQADGNRTKAAALLDMPVRTLSHKLSRHGIKKGFGIGE
ncbi:MAG: sigma 54-interacting transcriptional regulator [Deltaproteobacteria bacterium]|nr:sigma 54-interacting transcriptional regulator [Deltaproteobacteria bacterium]